MIWIKLKSRSQSKSKPRFAINAAAIVLALVIGLAVAALLSILMRESIPACPAWGRVGVPQTVFVCASSAAQRAGPTAGAIALAGVRLFIFLKKMNFFLSAAPAFRHQAADA